MDSKAPIVLVGMPRSGTTWLAKILDSHPETLYRHEIDSIAPLTTLPMVATDLEGGVDANAAESELQGILALNTTQAAGPLPIFPKAYRSRPADLARRLLLIGGKAWARFAGEVPVPDLVSRRRQGHCRLLWKSIESTGRVGALARLLPEARIIHILRHPGGQIASVVRGSRAHMFSQDSDISEDYAVFEMALATRAGRERGLTMHDVRAMTPVQRHTLRWFLFNEAGLEGARGCANCTTIRYEDVCLDPVGGARRLLEFAGLPWNEQTQHFVESSTASENSAYYSVFKDPARSISKWRQDISEADTRAMMEVVAGSRAGAYYEGDATVG